MRKQIPLRMIKIVVLSFFCLLILSFILFSISMHIKAKKKQKSKESEIPITELAPHSILNPPSWIENTTEKGTKYKYDTESSTLDFSVNGKNYRLIGDKIYRVNEDGSLSEVTDQQELMDAKRGLLDIYLNGGEEGKAIIGSDIDKLTEGMNPILFSNEEIQKLLDEYNKKNGTNLTYEDYVQGVKDGKDLKEILNSHSSSSDAWLDDILKESGLTKDELIQMLKDKGMTLEDFKKSLENGNKDNINLSNRAVKNGELISSVIPNSSSTPSPMQVSSSSKKDDGLKLTPLSRGIFDNKTPMTTALDKIDFNNNTYSSQNGQKSKNDFAHQWDDALSEGQWLSYNQIGAGTIIPMILITGINTDLPGQIIAQTTQNIYDTLTGKVLLLPKGTKLLASYDSAITFGQKRVLVAWTYLQRSDGFTLALPGFSGVDKMGYTGFTGSVNDHTWAVIGSSVLSSLVDAGVGVATNLLSDNTAKAVTTTIASDITTTGQKYVDKIIDLQPTIKIAPGTPISLLVNKTITLERMAKI